LGAGVVDVKSHDVETPDLVSERIRKVLEVLPPERVFILPDCGLFHLPRDVAFAKLKSMVEGTVAIRAELGIRT
jgi:5-methyltetrahydropteroyltriglutamate--homocysteine methyltransferase